MLRFHRCFLYAMESLLVLRKWGGDRGLSPPLFSPRAVSSLSWSQPAGRFIFFCPCSVYRKMVRLSL